MITNPSPDDFSLIDLISQLIRPPTERYLENGELVMIFEPPLTPAEQVRVERFRGLLRSAVRLTPDEWDTLAPEIDGLRTYHGLATPTQAQTVLAVKAIIRVLRALLRD